MSKKVYIVGGGGLAREIITWNNRPSSSLLDIVGCFDDNLNVWADYEIEHIPILGTTTEIGEYDNFIMGIMNVDIKERLFVEFKAQNKSFVSYFDRDSIVGDRSISGEGITLMPGTIISCDVRIGKLVTINIGTKIGHDSVVGNFCSLMSDVNLGGNVALGDKVFIGTGAVILPGVKIAPGIRVGAGSVVIRSLKEPGTYFGNPAKKIF